MPGGLEKGLTGIGSPAPAARPGRR